MLLRIWTLLVAIALATSAIAVIDIPAGEAVQLCEEPALDEIVAEPPGVQLSLVVGRAVPRTSPHTIPSKPPLPSIFRPPRLSR